MSQNNQIWCTFQLLKKHLQAEEHLQADIIFVCIHEFFIIHCGTMTCFNLGPVKKYAGMEFRSTFVFISLNWFLQTWLVAFTSEINTMNDLLHLESLCIPLSIIARTHRWLLCRDVDKETTQTCWIGTDQDREVACCIQHDCSVGNDAVSVSTWVHFFVLWPSP